MITDIPGEHYFINNEQYDHIMRKFYKGGVGEGYVR